MLEGALREPRSLALRGKVTFTISLNLMQQTGLPPFHVRTSQESPEMCHFCAARSSSWSLRPISASCVFCILHQAECALLQPCTPCRSLQLSAATHASCLSCTACAAPFHAPSEHEDEVVVLQAVAVIEAAPGVLAAVVEERVAQVEQAPADNGVFEAVVVQRPCAPDVLRRRAACARTLPLLVNFVKAIVL